MLAGNPLKLINLSGPTLENYSRSNLRTSIFRHFPTFSQLFLKTLPNPSQHVRKHSPDTSQHVRKNAKKWPRHDQKVTKKWPARAGNRTRYLGILSPRTNPLGYFGTRNELCKESLCFKNTELASQLLFFQNKSFSFFKTRILIFVSWRHKISIFVSSRHIYCPLKVQDRCAHARRGFLFFQNKTFYFLKTYNLDFYVLKTQNLDFYVFKT